MFHGGERSAEPPQPGGYRVQSKEYYQKLPFFFKIQAQAILAESKTGPSLQTWW